MAGPERVAAAAHLATCSDCCKRVDALQRMAGLLYQLPREPAPEGLAARIVAAVEAEARPAPAWTWQTLLVAGGAFVAGLLALWLAFETAVAAQAGGIVEFLSLLTSRPQTLTAYPSEVAYAVLEAVPATELVLTLGMALVALLLLSKLLAGLDRRRPATWFGSGAAGW